MQIFDRRDWNSPWFAFETLVVQGLMFLRAEFRVPEARSVRRASLSVAATAGALGNLTHRMNLYHPRINGQPVHREAMNPGQLSPRRGRALYRSWDVTALVRPGANALGLVFASDRISSRVDVVYADGSVECFGPDLVWKANFRGPFVRLWDPSVDESGGKGEIYDARQEFSGWDLPGFNDEGWRRVPVSAPAEMLSPQQQTVTEIEVLEPVSVRPSPDGWLYDFGQNTHGYVRLSLPRPRPGAPVKIRYAERIHPDGSLDPDSAMNKFHGETEAPFDQFTAADSNPVTWQPTFAMHGFRYVCIEGLPEPASGCGVVAVVCHSEVLGEAVFVCSDARINRLQRMGFNSIRTNLLSVPTDCPHRERNGWMGDALNTSEAACLNFRMGAFYDKWFDDIADSQEATGHIPYICPFPKTLSGIDVPWSAAVVCVAWDLWMATGEPGFLKRRYPVIRRWVEFCMGLRDSCGIIQHGVLWGDHVALDRPGNEFFGTAWYFRALDLTARIASALGLADESRSWEAEARATRDVINRTFFQKAGYYDSGSQSAQAHALHFGIVPDEQRPPVLECLAENIRERGGLTTGCHGTCCVIPALADNGRNDLVWWLTRQDSLGTWGHWISRLDATTGVETWSGKDFSGDRDVSHNHPFLMGSLCAWFYRHLAGIKPLVPGYAEVEIRPFCPEGLDHVSATLDTPKGKIGVSWQRTASGIDLRVQKPDSVRIAAPPAP